jgi:hypothetical protein
MTQNISTNPTTPSSPEEESVTDYLIRKVSGKKNKATTQTDGSTPVNLAKTETTAAAVPAPVEAESSGITLADLMVGICVIGLIGGVAAAIFGVVSGS